MSSADWASKDYYQVLGVAKDADAAAIKKAYRKLARENHPDSNPGDDKKHEKFKAVAEAYDVVGDAEKRKKYDEMHKTGRVKVLAMLNGERLESVKQYPAISESKQLKDFTFKIWTGYFVKKDTPEPVVTALHKAITGTLGDPAVHAALEANSLLLPKPQTLAEADKAYADGMQQFRAIVKSIGLQAQ